MAVSFAFPGKLAARKELLFAVAALAALVILFAVFWRTAGFVLLALAYSLVTMLAMIAVILIWAKVHYRRPSLKELFAEKKTLLAAIGIAEKQYLRRKLSEKDFNGIFKEKQKRLIEVEALIDRLYSGEKKEGIDEKILAVQAKKRHIMKEMLDEKKQLVKEIDIAEKSYLKRKIDAATYGSLVEKNQQRLVDIEASIKELYDEASVSKVMLGLKEKLSEFESEKKAGRQKKAKYSRKEILGIVRDISKQVSKK